MEQSIRNGLRVQKAVVRALFHREIKTRFAGYRLGVFWAVLEPMAHIGVFILIFGSRNHALSNGIDYPLYLLTGFLPFFLFSNTYSQVMNAPEGNQGLFGFRQVRPIDTMLARAIVELSLSSLSLVLLLAVFGWMGYEAIPDRILEFALAFVLLSVLGLGVGLTFSALQTLFHEFGKVLPLVMRPLYFVSGIMFNINLVPTEYRSYFLWNPILHGLEILRSSFFPNYRSDDASLGYLVFCVLLFLFVGFSLYSLHWKKMIRT